jgi:hypothetical protein
MEREIPEPPAEGHNSLIEVWIDESERRTWFLAEINQEV